MQTRPDADGPCRFCQLVLQEDLLGGWTVIRQWGYTGQRGSLRQQYFDDVGSALADLEKHRDAKLREGFTVTFVEGEEVAGR